MTKDEAYDLLVVQKKTLQEAGDKFGITRERVRQIFRKHFPEMSRDAFGKGAQTIDKLFMEEFDEKNKVARRGRESWYHESDLSRVISAKFTRKKQNTKKTKWVWDIEITDIQWPERCPILGVKLDYFTDTRNESSPSFDRINPREGYVKGNVQIISWRANRIKNDGTAAEHEKIAAFMRHQDGVDKW